MKIIIPALPSDYAKPYPKLVLEGTAEQMRDLGNVLSGLDRSDPRGICLRVTGKPGGQLLIKAIESALDDYAYITGYLGAYRGYDLDKNHKTLKSMRAAIRAKWVDHIERSIWVGMEARCEWRAEAEEKAREIEELLDALSHEEIVRRLKG